LVQRQSTEIKENHQMASTRDPAFGRKAPRLRAAVPILALLAAAVGSAASAPAGELAAQAAPATPAGTTSQQSPQRGPMTNVEARISELHKQLQITPAEEPQFKAYADVMRSNAQMMQTLFQQRAQNPDRTAVGQLRWYAKLTAAHAEAVSKLVAPFEALYQSMSDQQKKVADTVFAELRQRPTPHRAG
jgi:periplasmic protein CpxP/Spy